MEHPLVDQLGFCYELVEIILTYNQLALYNLASGEILMRRIQQIRHALSLSPTKPSLKHDILFGIPISC